MNEFLIPYLAVHAISTVGAIIVFLIRNEHRITKLEITVQLLKEQNDRVTSHLLG